MNRLRPTDNLQNGPAIGTAHGVTSARKKRNLPPQPTLKNKPYLLGTGPRGSVLRDDKALCSIGGNQVFVSVKLSL